MRFYELVFIARQDLTPAQVEGLARHYTGVIKEFGGDVKKTEFCGLRQLAYAIKKNIRGYYVLLNVEADHDCMKEVERQMKLNEDVLRNLAVRVPALNHEPSPLMQQKNYKDEISRKADDDFIED
jgi:small subunit ribosomal protein S6